MDFYYRDKEEKKWNRKNIFVISLYILGQTQSSDMQETKYIEKIQI